jgi:carbonic anhydrase/acetyltransferase-like protein (isoleucine patch superfamily)
MIRDYLGAWPKIDKEAFIAETAAVIGEVEVGAGTSVWYGAVLRGDEGAITVGRDSSIQDNAVLHCDLGSEVHIGNNVTVGHSAVVHGSTVGDNTLIGMGAIVLNGASIGEECIIAAGAVVKENAVIPARSMVVGVPGKIIRTLSDEQAEKLRQPTYYAKLVKDYLG